MSKKTVRRVLIPFAVCAALIGALLVLTGNLDDVALRPGTPASRPEVTGDPNAGDRRALDLDVRFLRHLLFIAFTVSLGVVLISALSARLLRRWLYFTVGLFGAILLFDLLASRLPSDTDMPLDDVTTEQAAVAVAEAEPRDWSRVLIAVGLSLGAGAALVVGSSCAVRWWSARRSRRADRGLAWELERIAQRTLGPGATDNLVLCCYREMLDLLSRKEHVPHVSLTAREFADRLRDLAVPTDAIDRLTAIFELVRYGHRDSDPLSKPAVATLESIKDGIGHPND